MTSSPTSTLPLPPGTVLAGLYRLDAPLGQGGMGSVWRAHQLSLNMPVAVKLIDRAIARHPDALRRFVREAQALAELRSAHIVQTLDFGVHEGVPFIVMELLEGETLSARLRRAGKLGPRETAALLQQVGRAVARSHAAGIVHRDLKPDNLFICGDAGAETVKVLDFGVAKTPNPHLDDLTATGALLGTPYYMSPEQAEGTRRVDHRSDLWALGVIAFECLLGRRPFQGQSFPEVILAICTRAPPLPSSLGPVPAGFDAWFARACARDPESRFGDVRELTARLCAIAEDSRSAPPPPPDEALEAEAAATTLAVASLASLETIALPTTGGGLARSATLPAAQSPARRRRAGADWFAVALCAGAMLIGAGLFAAFYRLRTLASPVASAATEPPPAASARPRVAPTPSSPAPPLSIHASPITREVPRVPEVTPEAEAPRAPPAARSARPVRVKRAPRERPSTDLGF